MGLHPWGLDRRYRNPNALNVFPLLAAEGDHKTQRIPGTRITRVPCVVLFKVKYRVAPSDQPTLLVFSFPERDTAETYPTTLQTSPRLLDTLCSPLTFP